MVKTLLSFSVKIRVLRLLNISKPSLNHEIFGGGWPKKCTTNSVFSFSKAIVSLSSSVKRGAVMAERCSVTVSGSDSSPGSDIPTAFSALTLNWYRHPGSRPLRVSSANGTNMGVARTQCGEPVLRCSTKYPVIGEPPSFIGGNQHMVTMSGVASLWGTS